MPSERPGVDHLHSPGARNALLSASVLNADFSRLAEQLREVELAGVDLVHVDVMDGHFVPNISLGFPIIEAIRSSTRLPLDVHLMIDRPERYLAEFKSAGATYLTVHQEAVLHLHRTLVQIRALGMRPGVALCPATPLSTVEEIAGDLDLLLIMTIDPGFGGQTLIPRMIDKVRRASALLSNTGSNALLAVDGGVKLANAEALSTVGANVLVIGTGIFQATAGIQCAVAEFRKLTEGASRVGSASSEQPERESGALS